MSAPSLAVEAGLAPNYPALRFNARERKILESVKNYVDAQSGAFQVVSAGEFTTVGGDASESITVAGALASDIAIVQLKTEGASPVTVDAAAAGSGAIAVTLSADPAADHVLSYVLLRANA